MPTINIPALNTGSIGAGLGSLSAKVFTGSVLSTTLTANELPASSGRFLATFTSPATAADYDVSFQGVTGQQYGTWSFSTDTAGNLIGSQRVIAITQKSIAVSQG